MEITPREKEVLRLMKRGARGADIGRALGISERTVKFHTTNILRKLNARNRTEAVFLASEQGWLE